MENNNGRGIFYGVIGVATLVVAMIGATFAYFSASISSEGDPIALNSTSIDLQLSQNTTGIKFNLIPVVETKPGFATGGYIGNKNSTAPHDMNCKDDDGNEFCSVYEVTVINPSTTLLPSEIITSLSKVPCNDHTRKRALFVALTFTALG